MRLKASLLLTVSLFALFCCFLTQGVDDYRYPAVFNFGDSNSDTGGLIAGLGYPSIPQNGQTYFRKPSGRYCDGRVIIDFLVNGWGLPFLKPYLDSVGAPSFQNGCNFAVGGSTILPANASSVSPFSFGIQVSQFVRFKARVLELLNKDSRASRYLPQKDYFAQGLYVIDIGQNDLYIALLDNKLVAYLPVIFSNLQNGIKKLYDQGARKFWMHNVGPMGCLPRIISMYGNDQSKLDQYGCIKSHNDAARSYNSQLQAFCSNLRKQFRGINVTYIDMFAIKSNLILKYSQYGFKQAFATCCGYGGLPLNYDSRVTCGATANINGRSVTAVACPNPAEYINWDGNHYTDAANFIVSSQILTGKYSYQAFLT